MYKRSLALLLAICIILSAAPVYAGAATGVVVSAGTYTAYPGNTVSVTLTAENFENVASAEVYLYYDATAFTVSSTANGSLLSGAQSSVNTAEAGTVKLVTMALNGISGTGTLLTVRFTVAGDCTPGTYPIRVAIGGAYDTSLAPTTIGATSGSITVNEPVETETFSISASVNKSTLQKDDALTYRVRSSSSSRAFVSGDFTVEYDYETLAFDSAELEAALTKEGAIYSVNSATLGQVRITYASTEPVKASYLFKVNFTVLADKNGSTTLNAQATNMYREDLSAYLPGSSSTTLTLKKQAEVADYPNAFLQTQELIVGQQSQSVFSLEAGAGVAAADFALSYDPTALKCVSVAATEEVGEKGGMLVINDNFGDGTIRFSYVNMSAYSETDLPLVIITWEPLRSPEAHYQITGSGEGVVNATQQAITLEYVTDTGCIFAPTVIPPTCQVDGRTNRACACGENYDVDPVEKLGHDIREHAAREETCTDIGWDAYEACSRCDYSTCVEIPALGHDYIDHEGKKVSCTDIGWDGYQTCSRCDYSSYVEISALGHDYIYHNAQTETCTDIGWDAYETCSRCSYSTYVEIPALGHDYIYHDAREANCTQIGWDAYETCSRCDYTTYVEIPAKGHSFVQTFCTVCGDKQLPLYTWDISADQDGSLMAYLYENHAEGGYEMEITGSGDMADFSYNAPWTSYRESLNRVTLPEGLTSIGHTAFYSCTALRQISIPDSVERIGDFAFYGAKKLVIILEGDALPAQQGSIWYWGCGYYLQPQKVILEADATYVIDRDGTAVLAKYVGNDPDFVARKSVEGIPVTKIGDYAFYQVSGMDAYWIPAHIQTIGDSAFYEAQDLVLYFESSTLPQSLGSSWNGSCPYFLAPLRVWEESDFVFVLDQSQQLHLVKYKANAREVTVPAQADGYPLEHIVDYAFRYKSAERIVLPEGIHTIGNYTFDSCANLKDIVLPQSLTSIGVWAFAYCTALTDIVLPGNVAQLDQTFVNCYALETVTLPQKLTYIGSMTFYGCYALQELDIPEQVHSLDSYSTFDSCSSLKLVYVRSPELAATLTNVSAASGLLRYAQTVVVPAGTGTDYLTSAYPYCETAQRDGVACDIYSNCDHDWQTQTVTTMVPCQTDGYEIHSCTLCNVQTDTVTPKHTFAETVVQPTCTEEGYTLHSCPDCLESYQTDPVEKLGHDYSTDPLTCGTCGHVRVTLTLNKVVLKPTVAGIYFKGDIAWDAEDTGILRCGIAVSLENPLPVADDSDPSCLYTQGGVSALITNILDGDNTSSQNSKNARMAVYARAYVQLADGQILYSDPVQASLQQVVMAVDNHWDALTEAQKDAIAAMYESFSGAMSAWQIPNIKAYT